MKSYLTIISTVVLFAFGLQAQGGPNDFFGGSVPSGSSADPPAAASGSPSGGGDYTEDEKRMQKKYKASIQHAKGLVSKGDQMMKSGEKRHNEKVYKKGKILKEIGEKRLAELQANNPFPEPIKENKISKGSK